MTGKLWDPVARNWCTDAGEATPYREGHSQGPGPGHKVVPRVVGSSNVSNFRSMWNLCKGLNDTCCNVSGHDGECKK